MNDDRLAYYIEKILESANDTLTIINGYSLDDFLADKRTQLAVNMCLLNIGEHAVRIIKDFPAFIIRHPDVPWHHIRGMRNRIVHGYNSLDLTIVWKTAYTAVPKLLQVLPPVLDDAKTFRSNEP